MSGSLGNKEVMAKNIERYMKQFNLDRNQLAEITDSSYFTVTAWLKARTYPRIDKIERMARYFKVSKSDLVEENNIDMPQISDTLTKINDVSSKLEAPRQQIVLETAQAQYGEQESSKIIDIRLTDEWLYEQVSHAVADDGIPLTEEQKQFYMKLLKKTMQERINRGE